MTIDRDQTTCARHYPAHAPYGLRNGQVGQFNGEGGRVEVAGFNRVPDPFDHPLRALDSLRISSDRVERHAWLLRLGDDGELQPNLLVGLSRPQRMRKPTSPDAMTIGAMARLAETPGNSGSGHHDGRGNRLRPDPDMVYLVSGITSYYNTKRSLIKWDYLPPIRGSEPEKMATLTMDQIELKMYVGG